MMMPAAALVSASGTLRRAGADPLRHAVEQLGHALPERADATVLLELLEDDLREGLDALGDVEAHFTDVLEALGADSALSLVDAGDDYRVRQRLDLLVDVVTRVRRRLAQAAMLMRQRPTT
jgi:hypothetical protein